MHVFLTEGFYRVLSVHKENERTVLEVYGELDEQTTPLLELALSDSSIPTDARVTLDLTKCSFMLSIAISALVRAKRLRGDAFQVDIAPSGNVHRVFEIAGIMSFTSVAP